MKKISVIVLVVASIFIYTSCQQIFTYSVLEWAQRDPSSLPPEQQIAYAESILTSGDTEAMAEAYAVIDDLVTADPTNVEIGFPLMYSLSSRSRISTSFTSPSHFSYGSELRPK